MIIIWTHNKLNLTVQCVKRRILCFKPPRRMALSDLLVDGPLAWAWQSLFLIFSQLQISILFHLHWRTSQDTLMEFLLTSGLYCLSMLTINHCWPLAVWCWWRCWCRRWCWNWVNANVAVDADMHGNVGVEVAVVYLLLLTINYHWLFTIVDFQLARQYRQQDHYQGLPKPPWILIMGIVPRRILNIFGKDFVLEWRKEFCKALFANYFSFSEVQMVCCQICWWCICQKQITYW